jgi:GNAT superfamily N-acetyltransferase
MPPVSGIPTDEAGWKALIRSGQPPGWRLLAEASGGKVWKREGVLAAIVPATPERSLFNSVFYRHPSAILNQLDQVTAAYEDAGIRAWTVWVPKGHRGVTAALERAGHKLDAEPRDMAMALSELREPDTDPELEVTEREDYEAMARINEVAYGYPEGEFAVVAQTKVPGMRIYFGRLDGADACTLAIGPYRSDAIVAWVAVLPEARGRGIAGSVLSQALIDAREAGLETTTLQATRLGYPVYARLGFRDYDTVQMWELRKD